MGLGTRGWFPNNSSALNLFALYFYYYINSISDPRGWGPLLWSQLIPLILCSKNTVSHPCFWTELLSLYWLEQQGQGNPCWSLTQRVSKNVCKLSHVQLFVTPRLAHQAPLSMGFNRQEYWSGLWFPPPGDLSDPGWDLHLCQVNSFTAEPSGNPSVTVLHVKF